MVFDEKDLLAAANELRLTPKIKMVMERAIELSNNRVQDIILNEINAHFGIDLFDLNGKPGRHSDYRKMFCYFLNKHTALSQTEMANILKYKTHANVIYNLKKHNEIMEDKLIDPWYYRHARELEQKIQHSIVLFFSYKSMLLKQVEDEE